MLFPAGGAKKGQILQTFCYYNAQNLEEFEKNQLPFLVFWKIKVFKANFTNFLLKYRENLKNSSLKPSRFQKKINFRFRFFEKFQGNWSFLRNFLKNWQKKGQILRTFCHYNAQNMTNLEKKNLTSEENTAKVSCCQLILGLIPVDCYCLKPKGPLLLLLRRSKPVG